MAARTLLKRLLYPDEKAMSTGVEFIGPVSTAHLLNLTNRPQKTVEELSRATGFAISSYAYAAMLWRASRMASAPLMVVRETPDGQEWQPNHPLVSLLEQPRHDIEMGEMLERTQMYRDLTASALWVVDADTRERRAYVTPFAGDEFRVSTDGLRIYGRYEIRERGGSWREVNRDTVIHFRETNPGSWRDGVSKVDAALLQLDLGHNVNRIVHAFLRKAMFPGGVISADKDWNPTAAEFQVWKDQVEAWYAGPAAQGSPLVVPGSTTVTLATSGMSGLLPEDILDRVEATIGSVFGVPPVVLGWLSGMKNSPWSQMAEARRAAYEDTIIPLWEYYSRRLSSSWLTDEERAAGLLVTFDTSRVLALKADQETQARVGTLASDVLTVNERRVMLGHDPLDKADPRGEQIAALFGTPSGGLETDPADPDASDLGDGSTAATVAAGEPVAATALNGAQVAALVDIVAQVTAGTLPPASASAIIAAAFPLLTPEQVAAIMADVEPASTPPADDDDEPDDEPPAFGGKMRLDAKALAWMDFDFSTKAREAPWERTVFANLQAVRSDVVKAARATLTPGKADPADGEAFDAFRRKLDEIVRRNRETFRAKVYPLVVSTGTAGVRRLASRVGVSFGVLQPGLLKYAAEEARFLARVMGTTTGEAVARTVQAGLAAGDTIAGLVKRLEDLPEFDRTRAKMTARTETTRAWNGAQRRAMSDYESRSGRTAMKTWLSARDQRVRDEHDDLDDGVAIPIDSPFRNGLQEPGEPNCRCTLLYSFADDSTPLEGTEP